MNVYMCECVNVCVCMRAMRGRWHCFNDRMVYELDEVDVPSPNAYLLFYVRRSAVGKHVTELFPRTGTEQVDISKIGNRGGSGLAGRCSVM